MLLISVLFTLLKRILPFQIFDLFLFFYSSPLSPKKYLIAVDRKHLYPTQASNIRKNRFVPILPAPSGTPTSINHNAVPSQFDSVSGDHQNKDVSSCF